MYTVPLSLTIKSAHVMTHPARLGKFGILVEERVNVALADENSTIISPNQTTSRQVKEDEANNKISNSTVNGFICKIFQRRSWIRTY